MSDRQILLTGNLQQIQDAGIQLLTFVRDQLWKDAVVVSGFPHVMLYRTEADRLAWTATPGKYPTDPSSSICMTAGREDDGRLTMCVSVDASDHPDVQAVTTFLKGLNLPTTIEDIADPTPEQLEEYRQENALLKMLNTGFGPTKVGKA